MVQYTNEVLALHELIQSFPEDDCQHLMRFVNARRDMSSDEVQADWEDERGRREEASKREENRQKQLVDDLLNTPQGRKNRDVIAKIFGVEAATEGEEAPTEVTVTGNDQPE